MVYNMQTSGKWLQTGGVWLSTQDEAGVSTVVISLPLSTESGLDLASLSYAVKGLIGASELRTALPAEVDDLGITLSWTVGPEWTANAGSMALTLIGSDDSGDIVIKWIGNSPVYVVADPIGSNTPAPDVAQQYLAQMQALLDQAGSGGGSGGDTGGEGEDLWEHILTYTEETGPDLVEHIFSQTEDGTPFNFKRLIVKVVAAAGTKNEYVTFNANRKSLNLGYVTGITTASGVTSVLILDTVPVKLASGELLRTADARIGVWNTATASSQYGRRGYGVPMYRFFDSIYEINVGGALPIGSTIEIYGVRA